MTSPLDDFFSGPDDAGRAQIRKDLVRRARTVRRHGWDDYQYVWSSGEVAGVAYLLQDDAFMGEISETDETVLSRYAYDLFGLRGGNQERSAGWTETRAWFETARAELDTVDR